MVTWTTDSAEEESAAVIWVLVWALIWALIWAATISAVDSGMVVLRGMPSVAVASGTESVAVASATDSAVVALGADLAGDVDLRRGSEPLLGATFTMKQTLHLAGWHRAMTVSNDSTTTDTSSLNDETREKRAKRENAQSPVITPFIKRANQ
jgi:hypothetical protein